MAISRGSPAGSNSGTATGTAITVAAPTPWASGSYALLFLNAVDNALTTAPSVTTLAGWTLLGSGTFGYGKLMWYGKLWASGESTATTWPLTLDRASVWTWLAQGYTGVDTTTPISSVTAVATPGSTLTDVTASVTPTDTNQWVVSFWGDRTTTSNQKTTAWTPTAPAQGQTIIQTNNSKTSAPWLSGFPCDDRAVVGSLAAQTRTDVRTGPTANANWQALIGLLNPAASTLPPTGFRKLEAVNRASTY